MAPLPEPHRGPGDYIPRSRFFFRRGHNAPSFWPYGLWPREPTPGAIMTKKGRGAAWPLSLSLNEAPGTHPLGPVLKLRGGGSAALLPSHHAPVTPTPGAWLCVPGSPLPRHSMYAPARRKLQKCSRRAGAYIDLLSHQREHF